MHQKIKVGIIEAKWGSHRRYYDNLVKSLFQERSLQLINIRSPWSTIRNLVVTFRYPFKSLKLADQLSRLDLDILHCPHELVPSFFWLTKGPRKIVTIHGAAPFMLGKKFLPDGFTWRRRYYRWSVKFFKGQINRFIALSESMKEGIARGYCIPRDCIDVIHPGVGTEFYQRASHAKIEALLTRLQIRTPYILWASSYRPVKNVVTLVKAFQQAAYLLEQRGQRISLLILGVKDGVYHEEVKAAIRNNKTKDRIHFIGPVDTDNTDLAMLFSGARATAVVSFYEGFPFPILESMACRVPVIATRVGGIPEAGGNAILYVDDPLDIDSICSAMIRIVSDDRLHKKLVDHGLDQVKQFCPKSFGDRMLRFYERILLGQPS